MTGGESILRIDRLKADASARLPQGGGRPEFLDGA